jgi:hypothetical protein
MANYSNWSLLGQCNIDGQPTGSPTPILNERVTNGPNPITFDLQLQVTDNDNVECFAWGTYSREMHTGQLGRGTTGLISVGRINGTAGGSFQGGDAEARFTMTWTATKM